MMSDEVDKKAVAVGEALAHLISADAVARRVSLLARGNVSLQPGAFVTGEQIAEERARLLAVDADDTDQR